MGFLTAWLLRVTAQRQSQHGAVRVSAYTTRRAPLSQQCGDLYLDVRIGVGSSAVPNEHGVTLREVARSLCCRLHLQVQKLLSASTVAMLGYSAVTADTHNCVLGLESPVRTPHTAQGGGTQLFDCWHTACSLPYLAYRTPLCQNLSITARDHIARSP